MERIKRKKIKYKNIWTFLFDDLWFDFYYIFIFFHIQVLPGGNCENLHANFEIYFHGDKNQKINPAISIFNVICNHFDNRHLREVEIFDAEGFEIFEFLCNLVIIFDILYLILIIKDKRTPKKPDDNKIIVKKQILTDDNRVDYKDEENIELNEKKIYSNENNNESDEDSDKNNNSNNNSNNKDDDNENENENDKNDEEINNNKYEEGDDEDINNNKNEDDNDQDNNCETNEINNNYNNKKDNEVINSINQENKNEENEEEEGMNENQETY